MYLDEDKWDWTAKTSGCDHACVCFPSRMSVLLQLRIRVHVCVRVVCVWGVRAVYALQLLQSAKRAVERHNGTALFRRVEYLASLGFMVEHRLWYQLELKWGSMRGQTHERNLFFTLADHFKWVA